MYSTKCEYEWCGIIPNIGMDIGTLYSWCTFGVVFTIILIPLAIWISQLSCTLCNRKGCVTFSVWSCWSCQLFNLLLLTTFLACSIFNPMLVKPITGEM